ncbi:WD40-repeat-containing domain protein [Dichotomocladium elegans]|nr:WD40-repeat-containing domain protein [Dichotomocladium elegans]
MLNTYSSLPENIRHYLLVHILRRSPMHALRLANSSILEALRVDVLSRLPVHITRRILLHLDHRSLCRASSVSRRWHQIIENDVVLWQTKVAEAGYIVTSEEYERYLLSRENSAIHYAQAYKTIYRRHYRMQLNWKYNRARRLQLAGYSDNVITCLQFDEDKIITGSDDTSVNIYDIKTGNLMRVLDGHEGGVWALQYVGNTLVTGSTDRTIRVWDIDTGRCRHIFRGHSSTVRCLTIVMPVETTPGHKEPQYPMIVSGSRDSTLRVWMLPNNDNAVALNRPRVHRPSILTMPLHFHLMRFHNPGLSADSDRDSMLAAMAESDDESVVHPSDNIYHVHELRGHRSSVRALAAHGNILASGSYDTTVRIWHLEAGQLRHVLIGHTQKVYSVVIDAKRNRCISGSMDSTVRIWNITTGQCEHLLGGHTILVGLLGISRNFLVSAAADQSLRVWSPDSGDCQHMLVGHEGPITSFQHDETKVVSGSDGGVKMWDIKTGKLLHNLVTDVAGVWRVAFDERRCVVAVKCPEDITRLEILDYGAD